MRKLSQLILFIGFYGLVIAFSSCSETDTTTKENLANDTTLSLVIREWSKKINEYPENHEYRYQRSLELAKDKKYPLALKDISKAITLAPENPAYLLAKGEIFFASNKTSDALAIYEEAVEKFPGNTLAHFRLGRLKFLIKEYEDAKTQLTLAVRSNRNDIESLWYLATVEKEMGDTLKAMAFYRQAMDVQPSHYNSIIQMANLLQVQKDTNAIQYYNAALNVDEFSDEAFYGRGLTYQQMGNYKKAIADYRQTIQLNPTHLFAWYNTANINMIEGHYEKALEQLMNTIKFAPDFAKAYNRIGQIYELGNQLELAEQYYAKALDLDPELKLAKEGLNRILNK